MWYQSLVAGGRIGANAVIADVAGIMVRNSQVLDSKAGRGGRIGMMEDGSFVEGISRRWLVQVML